jgi:hypothetical protein
MPGSWPTHELPNLTPDTCEVTSPATPQYNCIAWAAKDALRNWWPDDQDIGFWPITRREESIDAFIEAYRTLGYEPCIGGLLEEGIEKIAIFGTQNRDGSSNPTHAALQLESGKWTSKLGPFEDVTHESVDDVNGPVYGKALLFMSRLRSAT